MRKLLLMLLVFSLLLVSFASAEPHSQFPAFGAPHSGFSVNSNGAITANDNAVYKTGYYSSGGAWQTYTLTGNPFTGASDWLTGSVSASLSGLGQGKLYVITYSCSRVNSAWDCHGGQWQLQIVDIGGVTPTCNDNVRNGDETGVDCGGSCGPCVTNTDAIIADHNAYMAFNNDEIPDCWIEKAKNDLKISYAHTSHGGQITSGLNMLDAQSPNRQDEVLCSDFSGTPTLLSYCDDREGRTAPDGVLSYWNYHYNRGNQIAPDAPKDLQAQGHPLDAWADATRTHLNGAGSARNVMIWSWGGMMSYNSASDVQSYVNAMNNLENDYPNVQFVYMTGHVDGSSSLHTRNDIIRDYVEENNKILFDFADIESWDPAGNYYADDNGECEWCISWCSSNSCPTCGECEHSECLSCFNKGKAFWWMLARMAGWDGTPGHTCTDGSSNEQSLISVSSQEFYNLLQTRGDAILLDIRTPEEYNTEHIAGAQNIDFYEDDFQSQLDALDKTTAYLIYCRSGSRSGQTLPIMETLGFQEVYDLDDGINDWKAQGYPVV